MRKIRLLTFLALMLGSIVSTQAQEKQNDATWEETVEFINDNLQYAIPITEFKQEEIKCEILNNEKLKIEVIKIKDGERCTYKYTHIIPLRKLKEARYYIVHGEGVELEFAGKYVKTLTCKWSNFASVSRIVFSSQELAKRMAKAFKHLAYLANEKRKESKF